MHHLRDSLLSSVPKDSSNLPTGDYVLRDQEDARQSVARGEFKQVRETAFSNRTWAITSRYCSVADGVDTLEDYIHPLWYMYYGLGRSISCDAPEHEGIVLDILRIQGMEPLTRPSPGGRGIDIARTVDGALWTDLPFFAGDMANLWSINRATMSGAHRLNFATFLAKLASARVAKDRLYLRTGELTDDEDLHRGTRDLEVFHLLPAAVAWLKEVGHNLVLLSDVYWNDCPSDVSKGGRDFLESELGQRSPAGFSPWRYIFWLKRLAQIQEEAKEANEKALESLAEDGCEYMVNMIRDKNSEIIRAYKTSGDSFRQDKHLSCLRELAYPEVSEE
ncbi:unnamed protein product [Penicillium salamii]|uniref:Uncharacterized protein n=1 Tax=Penicillium salamii TaxID=1612424 RepID=A0A9W4JWE1_9EURO|nr:unnamed protein product [Penicillium salamii]